MSTTVAYIIIAFVVWLLVTTYFNERRRRKSIERREAVFEYLQSKDAESQDTEPQISDVLCNLKGLSYRTLKDIGASRLLDPGDLVILQRELDNEYDPYAIKVMTRPGNFIGYVDARYSKMLSQKFDYLTGKVASIRHTEIPFISLRITVSQTPTPQPRVETDPNNLTPSERMMIL